MEIQWRAFELRPEPVPNLRPPDEHIQMVWIRSVYPLAAKLGLKMRMPPVRPRSRLAHEAAAWARKHAKFEAMNEAIFRGFFERSLDIGKVQVLAELAVSAGLDSQALKASLESHEHLQEVLADEAQAQHYGLTGVPAFVTGKRTLVGVQTEKSLEQLLSF